MIITIVRTDYAGLVRTQDANSRAVDGPKTAFDARNRARQRLRDSERSSGLLRDIQFAHQAESAKEFRLVGFRRS